ncbi:MAG: hypothetical protein QOE90_3406 [Thermoplasmata archaeon]|nr:hypothetical protein [Thermoplasmata archaeon]
MKLHVETDGPEDAPPVLMLHGALATGAAFRSQRVALRDHFRLAAPDLRGHGKSPHLARDQWDTLNLDTMTRDVEALMDLLSPDAPLHLVGVSMGGILAAWCAARRPSRVASLALLSTSGTPSAKRRHYFATITPETLPVGTQRLSALWHGEPYWRELGRHLFAYFAQTSGEHYPERLAPPRALVVQANDDEILTRTDFEAWVERIDAPVQVVHAPGDHAFFADGRAGSRAANAALRHFLLEER